MLLRALRVGHPKKEIKHTPMPWRFASPVYSSRALVAYENPILVILRREIESDHDQIRW